MNEHVGTIDTKKAAAEQEQLSWFTLGGAACIKIIVTGVLFCYLFYNDIHNIIGQWDDPTWSHGILIPFFSLYFLNIHKKEILTLQTRPNWLGLVFLLFLFVLYPVNFRHFGFAYGQPIIMLASLGAIILFLGGWKLVRYTWLPAGYLIFAIPLPERFYKQITIPMRIIAADSAAFILNFIPQLRATANGVVIDVIYKGLKMEPALDVAEACSGMRLLMAFLALGVAMAYLHYRPIWQRLVLLACTIPIAILCNIVRVTITGLIYILWDPQYAQGIYHDMLGLLMLPLAFGFYGAIAWFMSNLFVADTQTGGEDIVYRRNSGNSATEG